MAQTVQILRTTTNNPPPTLLPGALSVELGTQTKLWVGSAGGNRLLMSSDPADIALSSGCVVAATPPANPIPGLLWWDSTGGQLYVRYQDPNSTAWIAASSVSGAFLPLSGGTLTGPLILSGPPTDPLGAATKAYADGKLALTGGTMTGNLTISPASGPAGLMLNKVPGEEAILYGMRNGVTRWRVNVADGASETGSNAGSNFDIQRHNDAGAFIDTPLSINRATGSATFLGLTANGVTSTSNSWFQTYTRFGNTTAPASTTQIAVCFPAFTYGISLRPNVAGGGGMLAFENVGSALIGSITNNDTNVAYNTSSDARLKEDLQSFDAGPMIDATNVYDYAWIATGERGYGVIAQEAITVYPQAVSYVEMQDSWGVDYSKYVPLLLQELKTLRGRVAALEGAP